MPRISRQGDRCRTGHLCSKSAPVNASQFSVFANGKAVLTLGSRVAPHTILKGIKCIPHVNQKLNGSSRKVFAEGRGVGRKGDRADGKGMMKGASGDVIAG